MSSPAGWYPQADGRQRYWDGELWTERFKGDVTAETIASPWLKTTPPAASTGRSFSKAAAFGWGGLALVCLAGALTSGLSGATGMLGCSTLMIGVFALTRGHVGWARLRSRAAGGVAVGVAVLLFIFGALVAPSSTPPTSRSTAMSSDTATTTNAAAEAAAASAAEAATAQTAAAEVAATEAAAAAETAAAEAAAQATAEAAAAQAVVDAAAAQAVVDAAAAQAVVDATAAKAFADAVTAKRVKSAAAAKAKAVAAASAKRRAAPAAASEPEPPAPSAYYANCSAARAAGVTPIYRGQPGYASKLDRDHDGIACE